MQLILHILLCITLLLFANEEKTTNMPIHIEKYKQIFIDLNGKATLIALGLTIVDSIKKKSIKKNMISLSESVLTSASLCFLRKAIFNYLVGCTALLLSVEAIIDLFSKTSEKAKMIEWQKKTERKNDQ